MASALAVEGLAVEALAVEGLAIETLTIEALVVEGLAVEALAIGDLAVEAVAAPAFTTGDSSGAWLEFPSDLMDGAAGGGTGTAKTCPGSFWGSLSGIDRKSTHLNSSHLVISYSVFCLKKKLHKTARHWSILSTPVRAEVVPPGIVR